LKFLENNPICLTLPVLLRSDALVDVFHWHYSFLNYSLKFNWVFFWSLTLNDVYLDSNEYLVLTFFGSVLYWNFFLLVWLICLSELLVVSVLVGDFVLFEK